MKTTRFLLALVAALSLVALVAHPALSQSSPSDGSATVAEGFKPTSGSFGRVFIIYYSQTGMTQKIVDLLKASLNADLGRIELAEPLPTEPEALIQQTRKYHKDADPAELKVKTAAFDLSGYDLVFVGGPVWFSRPGVPLANFLATQDFGGKKVALFLTAGSRPNGALDLLGKSLKNAEVIPGGKVFDRKTLQEGNLQELVAEWLSGLKIGS
jgi:flavodoxin